MAGYFEGAYDLLYAAVPDIGSVITEIQIQGGQGSLEPLLVDGPVFSDETVLEGMERYSAVKRSGVEVEE